MRSTIKFLCAALLLSFAACNNSSREEKASNEQAPMRIVSLNGAVSETICKLGMQDKIAGVDVTSTFPEALKQLPKTGHGREAAPESIIALQPTIVLGLEESIKPELKQQLAAAHIHLISFKGGYSVAAAKELIQAIADSLNVHEKAAEIQAGIDKDLSQKVALSSQPRVLFIYARGAGTLMVAGENSPAASIINLAGGQNAATGFEGFKPLTPESLVAANPDVILMFSSGLESLGGMDGLLKIPGVSQTNAGKSKHVIEMDGQLLTGFGPRTGEAVATLSKKLSTINEAPKK